MPIKKLRTVGNKISLGRFTEALREINNQVSKFKLSGIKAFYTITQIRSVYQLHEGHCAKCGVILNPTPHALNTVFFRHRVALENGGRIHPSNLIPLCRQHADQKDRHSPPPEGYVIDYNTIADIIVQLVTATVEKKNEKIIYFKRLLDVELCNFVRELGPIPIGLDEDLDGSPYEGRSSISELVSDLTLRIVKIFEEIGASKRYNPLRDI